jgi:O-Antigen ligase
LLTRNRRIILLIVIGVLVPLLIQHPIAAYLCTLAVLALIFKDKVSGVLFLFVYFPLRPFLIEVNGGLKLTGDIIILLLFLLTLVHMFRTPGSIVKKYAFILAFIGFCLTGTIAAFSTGVGLPAIIFQNRAFIITFLLIFIAAELDVSRENVRRFLWITIIMGAVLSIHGLVEFIGHRTVLVPQAWEEWNLSSVNEMRVYGLTANPNVLGTYLSICLFVSLYMWQTSEKYKAWLSAASILMLGALCLTFSRGSILAFGIAYVLYFLLTRNWRLAVKLIITAVTGLAIIYYPANMARDYAAAGIGDHPPESHDAEDGTEKKEEEPEQETRTSSTFSKRFKEMFSDEIIQKSSEWGRLYVVFKGLEIFMEHPVIGTGFGTYGDSATLSYGSPITEEFKLPDRMYSDNQYIQLMVQTGTIGTLLVLAFVVFIIRKCWKDRRHPLSPVLFSFLIAILAMALFYNVLEEKVLTLYFYTVLGYFLREGELKKLES